MNVSATLQAPKVLVLVYEYGLILLFCMHKKIKPTSIVGLNILVANCICNIKPPPKLGWRTRYKPGQIKYTFK